MGSLYRRHRFPPEIISHAVWRSPMPGDYGSRQAADELGNLFAFLARQSLRATRQESQ